ncbi:hypothetical protein Q3G72_014557 [Acer saccharum]|nr:hypothetical protein Q3G72_014557 [Acer saccharum]
MPTLVRIGKQFRDSRQLSSLFFYLVTAAAPATGSVVNPLPNTSNSRLLGASSVGFTSEFLLWSIHEGSSKLSSPPPSSANC